MKLLLRKFIGYVSQEGVAGQVDQLPELFTGMQSALQLRQEVESAPVLIAELAEAGTVLQQLRGTEKKAPPHRFRELFLAWTVIPKSWVVLDDPEPVAHCEVMRVDICAEITVARQ